MRKKLFVLTAVLVVGLVMLPAAVAQYDTCKCGTPKCKYEHMRAPMPHEMLEGQPLTPQKAPSHGGRGTWEFMGPEGGTFAVCAVDPADPNIATIMASGGSVYNTTDGGASWNFMSSTPHYAYDAAAGHGAIYILGYNPDTFTYDISFTNDNGATWTSLNGPGGTDTPYSIALHPTDPDTIFVGGYFYNSSGPHLYEPWFHVTTDGGANWTSTDLASYGWMVPFGIDVSANNPDVIYMGGYDYDISSYTIMGACLASTDGGATWTYSYTSANPSEYPTGVYIDPTDDLHVIAPGTHYMESFDGGATWQTHSYGLVYHYGLAFDPTNSLNIYMAGSDGLFVSNDGGVNWTVNDVGGMAYYPAVCAGTPSTIYSACYYVGVVKSIDSGATWDNVCNGILESRVYGVEVAQSSPNRVYSSPYGFTAFQVSEDSGENWNEINIPPEGTYVYIALENSNQPDNLLVSLPGG